MPEKRVSSLHDDLQFPYEDRLHAEYDAEKGYPNRHPSVGENGEFSVLQRISQFGITKEDLESSGVGNLMEITEEQYRQLVSEALQIQYDTIFGSVFLHWSEIPDSAKQFEGIKRIAEAYKSWGLNIISRGNDVQASQNFVIALEGGDFIRESGDVQKAFDLGIRSINIQYGRENAVGNLSGLTDLGKQVVRKMFDLGVIVDLAHSPGKTRADVLSMAEELDRGRLVAYTHGATQEDIARDAKFASASEARGLSQEEIKKIIKLGGIVGLGVSKPFFQNIEHVVERIDQLCQVDNGPQSLGLGTDFGGVAPVWTFGIDKSEDIYKLGDALSERFGYSDATIANILRSNVHEWVKKNLK